MAELSSWGNNCKGNGQRIQRKLHSKLMGVDIISCTQYEKDLFWQSNVKCKCKVVAYFPGKGMGGLVMIIPSGQSKVLPMSIFLRYFTSQVCDFDTH